MEKSKKENLLKLVRAISTRVQEKDGYLNKTKLIKLLYLIDIEFFKTHKKTFTDFNWIFKDYGPWAYEYNEIFQSISESPYFQINEGDRLDIDTIFIKSRKKTDLSEVTDDIDFKFITLQLIDKWADRSLDELLNFVYFYTEPMMGAVRGNPLDFNKITRYKDVEKFELSKSSLSPQKLNDLRKTIKSKIAEFQGKSLKRSKPTPAKYDETYLDGMKVMDSDDSY
jgi:hypothetical protein